MRIGIGTSIVGQQVAGGVDLDDRWDFCTAVWNTTTETWNVAF